MSISRGTTPTFTLTFTDQSLNLTSASHIVVTFSPVSPSNCLQKIEKSDSELTIAAKSISVYLTQAESLVLSKGDVAVQANWTYSDGSRMASEIAIIQISENLVGRVIE